MPSTTTPLHAGAVGVDAGTPAVAASSTTSNRAAHAGLRSRLARRVGATILAVGISASLAACGSAGTGTGGATMAPATTDASATGTTDSQCGDVRATLATVEDRLNGIPGKIPGDIPGAISDVQTSVTDLQTQRDELREGELKTYLDDIITIGNEALDILNQAQAGEISPLEATAQGTAKLLELQGAIQALKAYCAIA